MRYTIIAIIALCTVIACKNTKKAVAKTPPQTVAAEPRPFKVDTITPMLKLAPEPNGSMMITNVQVYVVTKNQPAAGVRVVLANGETKNYILPQIQNLETFSFGGNMKIPVPKGAHVIIDVFDGTTSKPMQGKMVVMGYHE